MRTLSVAVKQVDVAVGGSSVSIVNHGSYRDRRIEMQTCWLVALLLVAVKQVDVAVGGSSESIENDDSYRDRRIEM